MLTFLPGTSRTQPKNVHRKLTHGDEEFMQKQRVQARNAVFHRTLEAANHVARQTLCNSIPTNIRYKNGQCKKFEF